MTNKPLKNLHSIAGSLIKQNGGRVERSKTMSDRFNIKDHGQIRLQDDDTSTGTQSKVLFIMLSGPFLIFNVLFTVQSAAIPLFMSNKDVAVEAVSE